MPPRSLAELLFGPRQATGVASVPPSTLKALASPEPPVLTAAPPESKLSQLAGSLRELLRASQGTARGDVGPIWQFLNAPASETWSAAKQQLLDAVASQADNDHRTFLTPPSVVDPNPWMTRAQNELGHVARAGRKALAFTGQVLTPESNLDAATLGAGKIAAALPLFADLARGEKAAPLLVAGGSAGRNIPSALAHEPAFTIKATPKEPIRAIIDGTVRRLPARALARLQGVPDSYPLPESEALAKTVLGNGVPPPVMDAVVSSMKTHLPNNATGVDLFSGGGISAIGSGKHVQFIGAVEANPEIAAHYARAHGPHVIAGDVRNIDYSQWAGADYLHASPVCKNFSAAKAGAAETPLDMETATATARAIREVGPRVITVENVPKYAGSEAMRTITDELNRLGYKWDARVYDAADFGVPQHRKRLVLRAVREGELPPPPSPTGANSGWYDAVRNIEMPASQLAPWQEQRLRAAGRLP